MELLIIILVFIGYFLPALNAYSKKTRNRESVLIINLFLGWTFLGWVIALAMSVSRGREI